MTRVEERLAELLDAAAPPSDGVAFDDVVRRVRRRRSARWSVAAAAVAVAALVGGATAFAVSQGGGASRVATTPAHRPKTDLVALTRHVTCPQKPEAVAASQFAAFHAVTIVTCDQQSREIPGEGQWAVYVRRVAIGGVAAVQDAFAHPTPATAAPGICTFDLVSIPPLVLVDGDGRSLAPKAPLDGCFKPPQQLLLAIRAVTWQDVSVRKLHQILSPQAEAAGCPQQVKNMPFEMAPFHPPLSPGGPVFIRRPKTVRVCVYRTRGADFEIGNFERGFVASETDTTKLLDAVSRPGVGGSCAPQRSFAVIFAPAYATVELGGCWRVERSYPHESVGSADAAAVDAVLSDGSRSNR